MPRAATANGTGCCYDCNHAKGQKKLLPFLLHEAKMRDRRRAHRVREAELERSYRTGETRRQRAERLRKEEQLNRSFFSKEQMEFMREAFEIKGD